MANSLVLGCQYHLGDNPGLFQDATFVGYILALPLAVTLDTEGQADQAVVQMETHDLETWDPDNWLGHPVRLTGQGETVEIGRLKDPDDRNGRAETFRLNVATSELGRLLGGDRGSIVLTVEVEKQEAKPGLSDDFVLTRLEIAGASARLGVQA